TPRGRRGLRVGGPRRPGPEGLHRERPGRLRGLAEDLLRDRPGRELLGPLLGRSRAHPDEPERSNSPWYCARRTFLSNFPTLVFGISPTNSTRSGSHHFGNCGEMNSSSSSLVADASGFKTTHAIGRSLQRSSGMAMTAASSTAG